MWHYASGHWIACNEPLAEEPLCYVQNGDGEDPSCVDKARWCAPKQPEVHHSVGAFGAYIWTDVTNGYSGVFMHNYMMQLQKLIPRNVLLSLLLSFVLSALCGRHCGCCRNKGCARILFDFFLCCFCGQSRQQQLVLPGPQDDEQEHAQQTEREQPVAAAQPIDTAIATARSAKEMREMGIELEEQPERAQPDEGGEAAAGRERAQSQLDEDMDAV